MTTEFKVTSPIKNARFQVWVPQLIAQFEALAPLSPRLRKVGVKGVPGWEKIAANMAKEFRLAYPDKVDKDPEFADLTPEEKELKRTYGTARVQISHLKKALSLSAPDLVQDRANLAGVKTIIEKHFSLELSKHFTSYGAGYAKQYKSQVIARRDEEQLFTIDLTDLLKRAYTTLEAARDANEGKYEGALDYRDVSCALALASGRRMTEIHHSAEFTLYDDEHLIFKGQAKAKGRTEQVDAKGFYSPGSGKHVPLEQVKFIIPTLVPAQLVIAGLVWLDNAGKRINEKTAKKRDGSVEPKERWALLPNSLYGRYLSERVKQYGWAIPGLPLNADTEEDKEHVMTYHRFRAAYALASLSNAGDLGMKANDFLCEVLGDRSATIAAYDRYRIEPGSLTRHFP